MIVDLLISTALTIVMSGGVAWLAMRYIAHWPLTLSETTIAAVLPVLLIVPLELAAGFLLPVHPVAVYLAATVLAIAVQAFVVRALCRRRNAALTWFKATMVATLAMLGCILMGSPIYPLVLDRVFMPGRVESTTHQQPRARPRGDLAKGDDVRILTRSAHPAARGARIHFMQGFS